MIMKLQRTCSSDFEVIKRYISLQMYPEDNLEISCLTYSVNGITLEIRN